MHKNSILSPIRDHPEVVTASCMTAMASAAVAATPKGRMVLLGGECFPVMSFPSQYATNIASGLMAHPILDVVSVMTLGMALWMSSRLGTSAWRTAGKTAIVWIVLMQLGLSCLHDVISMDPKGAFSPRLWLLATASTTCAIAIAEFRARKMNDRDGYVLHPG
jgi:hypothetical protein